MAEVKTDIEDVLNALARVIDATNEHDKARDAHKGYSWDYYGAALIHERNKARADLAERLNAYIDQRIADALDARPTPILYREL
jgi:hypothetical protein